MRGNSIIRKQVLCDGRNNSPAASMTCVGGATFAVVTLLCVTNLFGESPRERMLSRLPAATGLCIEGHALSEQWKAFRETPMRGRIAASPLMTEWLSSKGWRQIEALGSRIEKESGKPFGEFLSEVFGQHVVLAAFPRGEKDPYGLLMTEASSEDALNSAMKTWKKIDPAEWETVTLGERRYLSRVTSRSKTKETLFVFREGTLLALSDREVVIKELVNRFNAETVTDSLLEADWFVQATNKQHESAFLRVAVNCRAWDDSMNLDGAADAGGRWFRDRWREAGYLAANLRIDRGLRLHVVMETPSKESKAEGSAIAEITSGDWTRQLPEEVAVAVHGRKGFSGLQTFAELDEDSRDDWARIRGMARGVMLGQGLFTDVLPNLGPEWTLALSSPSAPEHLPLVPVRLTTRMPRSEPIRAGLTNGLTTVTGFLSAMMNADATRKAVVVQTEKTDRSHAVWISGRDPLGPGFAVNGEELIIASSGEGLKTVKSNEIAVTAAMRNALKPDDVIDSDFAIICIPSRLTDDLEARLTAEPDGNSDLRRLVELAKLFDVGFLSWNRHADSVVIRVGCLLP